MANYFSCTWAFLIMGGQYSLIIKCNGYQVLLSSFLLSFYLGSGWGKYGREERCKKFVTCRSLEGSVYSTPKRYVSCTSTSKVRNLIESIIGVMRKIIFISQSYYLVLHFVSSLLLSSSCLWTSHTDEW